MYLNGGSPPGSSDLGVCAAEAQAARMGACADSGHDGLGRGVADESGWLGGRREGRAGVPRSFHVGHGGQAAGCSRLTLRARHTRSHSASPIVEIPSSFASEQLVFTRRARPAGYLSVTAVPSRGRHIPVDVPLLQDLQGSLRSPRPPAPAPAKPNASLTSTIGIWPWSLALRHRRRTSTSLRVVVESELALRSGSRDPCSVRLRDMGLVVCEASCLLRSKG